MPSNKNFGYTFFFIFIILGIIFSENYLSLNLFYIVSIFFLVITIFVPKIFTPLNKLWFKFGIFLSKIISPIILSFFYYFLFTPYSIIIRLFDKSYQNINLKKFDDISKSNWIELDKKNLNSKINFKDQF